MPESEHTALPKPRLGHDEGRVALTVDGVVQSVAVEERGPTSGYWWMMLPGARPRQALILGLGGGTVAQLLTRRFGEVSIVGVERDPAVVDLARQSLGLDLPNLDVVVADAFAYVESCESRFDYIAVDLYAGSELVRGVLAKPFLRRLRAMLTPGGNVAFNLTLTRRLPKQLQRLGEVLRIVRADDEGLNVVVHCRQ